jgi:hypothetical protein
MFCTPPPSAWWQERQYWVYIFLPLTEGEALTGFAEGLCAVWAKTEMETIASVLKKTIVLFKGIICFNTK